MLPLINQETGEIEMAAIVQRAPLRAADQFGAANYPAWCLREALDWLKTRAEAESRQWYRDRGILVPGEDIAAGTVPDWGNSGDSFGAR